VRGYGAIDDEFKAAEAIHLTTVAVEAERVTDIRDSNARIVAGEVEPKRAAPLARPEQSVAGNQRKCHINDLACVLAGGAERHGSDATRLAKACDVAIG
jgi:hypothetical protein